MAKATALFQDSVKPASPGKAVPWARVLCIAVWFGVLTGLLEGCGLLVFQNLNQTILDLRVSAPILWISPAVDVVLFFLLALLIAAASSVYRRINPVRAIFVLISSLAVYDFLTLTARLSSRSRVLLAIGVGFAVHRWIKKHELQAWRFCRRTVPWVVAAGVLAFAGIQGGRWFAEANTIAKLPAPAPGSPNVLVIVIDTLRADHLSSYGYSHPTSPNIDGLAREGVLFENAVSNCSWTYPSHVSLVTGRRQFEHGRGWFTMTPLFHPDEDIFNGYPTIGDVLQNHGYRTGAFSANRAFFAGNLGFGRGFIHFDDYYHSLPDMFARSLAGREFLRLYGKAAKGKLNNQVLSYGLHNGFRKQPAEVNEELLHWIDKTGSRPFFAFLNYFSVHAPYGAPGSPQIEPKGTTQDIALYDQGIQYTDRYIGELLKALKQRGLDKNTLVIVTADHGESLGEDTRIFPKVPLVANRLATAQTGAMKSVVSGQWHLIVHEKFGEQLYDWHNDPGEAKNLIQTPEGQNIAGRLLADLANQLSGSTPESNPDVLPDGLRNAAMPVGSEHLTEDPRNPVAVYDVSAEAGTKINITARLANLTTSPDPVLSIANAAGQIYQTCRNRGDDTLSPPGVPDPTPQDFDDICIRGGFHADGKSNSELEILVPGKSGSSTTMRIRISDWNGHPINNSDYLITTTPEAQKQLVGGSGSD